MALIFDPHAAELLGYDVHLPAVSAEAWTREALVHRFLQPPVWTPEVRVDRALPVQGSTPAAVLIPLVMRPQPTVLLTQRTSHLSKHAGQISFPGGRSEPDDGSPEVTALREAQEETGLAPDRVRVLGQMPTYTTITGFLVTPVVGLITPLAHEQQGLALQPDPGEVAEAFEVPLDFLMNPQHHQRRAFTVGDRQAEFFAMPWTAPGRAEPYFIWGATAAMLRNLYRLLIA